MVVRCTSDRMERRTSGLPNGSRRSSRQGSVVGSSLRDLHVAQGSPDPLLSSWRHLPGAMRAKSGVTVGRGRLLGLVAQSVSAPPCQGGGRGFESRLDRHLTAAFPVTLRECRVVVRHPVSLVARVDRRVLAGQSLGRLPERPNGPAWKAVRGNSHRGSNPLSSAARMNV